MNPHTALTRSTRFYQLRRQFLLRSNDPMQTHYDPITVRGSLSTAFFFWLQAWHVFMSSTILILSLLTRPITFKSLLFHFEFRNASCDANPLHRKVTRKRGTVYFVMQWRKRWSKKAYLNDILLKFKLLLWLLSWWNCYLCFRML